MEDYGAVHPIPNREERYQFVNRTGDDFTSIGIKGGKFEGVVYKYGKVTVGEEEDEQGNLPFSYEYDILDPNSLPRDYFGEDFFILIGDILVDVIDKQVGNDTND